MRSQEQKLFLISSHVGVVQGRKLSPLFFIARAFFLLFFFFLRGPFSHPYILLCRYRRPGTRLG